MIGISKEDIAFLKELQHEMLTQGTVCQASPRFWVVQGTVKEYGIDSKYDCDGSTLVDIHDEWREVADNLNEAYTYLTEELDNVEDYKFELTDSDVINRYYHKNSEPENQEDEIIDECICDLEDAAEFINRINENEHFEVCHYKNVDKNYENTMFLTNRECKAHIKSNYYHYPKDAHSYAMTAWRAPEVSKLFDILDKINWSEVETLIL